MTSSLKSPAVATTPSAPASPPSPTARGWRLIGKAPRKFGHSRCTEDHLARFPTCDFAALAKARIETLKK